MPQNTLLIPLKIVGQGEGLSLPTYARPGDAGVDLYAAFAQGESFTLLPGKRTLVPTGIALAIPAGWEMQIRPRSGLAYKYGISICNSPGTIDSGFRNEVGVLLVHLGEEPFTINRGDRIAQMVLCAVARAKWAVMDELPTSERGMGGFGHTGTT